MDAAQKRRRLKKEKKTFLGAVNVKEFLGMVEVSNEPLRCVEVYL